MVVAAAIMPYSVTSSGRTLNISVRSMGRLLFPLFALILVVFGRWALSHWYSTHLLNIVVPLLFALALIRAAVYMLRRVFSRPGMAAPMGTIYRLDGVDWTGALCNGSSAGNSDISR